ncbi:MAG: hypothetical protein WCF97_07895 [Nitrososphaeraceae archaeon]
MEKRDTSKDAIQNNKEKCGKILSLSKRIRYVGMINDFGRTIAGKLRVGMVPLLNTEQAINDHFIEATRNNLRKAFYSVIGNAIYTLTEHEKVIVLTVPIDWGFYYITLDKETGHVEIKEIIDKVLNLIPTIQ